MDIFEAIYKGDFNTVKSFIDNGGDVNFTDDSGYTLLSMSALIRQNDIVQYLLQKGAKTDFITDVATLW